MSTQFASTTEREQALDDVTERGSALYDSLLKARLEPDFPGQYVAIHPDSGDYEVAGWSGDAIRAIRRRHQKGLLFVRVIGPPTEQERRMAARLIAAEQGVRP